MSDQLILTDDGERLSKREGRAVRVMLPHCAGGLE